jgi:hypothetical protein
MCCAQVQVCANDMLFGRALHGSKALRELEALWWPNVMRSMASGILKRHLGTNLFCDGELRAGLLGSSAAATISALLRGDQRYASEGYLCTSGQSIILGRRRTCMFVPPLPQSAKISNASQLYSMLRSSEAQCQHHVQAACLPQCK